MIETYVGLADCHGVESFECLSVAPLNFTALLQQRAHGNDQRHAVVFRVALNKATAKSIKELLEQSKNVEALNMLKDLPNIQLVTGFEGRWNNIPNHNLDPYWSGNPERKEYYEHRPTTNSLD